MKMRDCIIQIWKAVWRAIGNTFSKVLTLGEANTPPPAGKKKIMKYYRAPCLDLLTT